MKWVTKALHPFTTASAPDSNSYQGQNPKPRPYFDPDSSSDPDPDPNPDAESNPDPNENHIDHIPNYVLRLFSFGCKQESKQYRSEGRAEGHWLLLLLFHSQVDLSRTSRGL